MHQPTGVKAPGKAALASWIGSAVEYYDFFIYGTAAALTPRSRRNSRRVLLWNTLIPPKSNLVDAAPSS